ncbi:MAG TPA: diaminopimelate decarboxylase, partial [candidate division Zixibacteria bacterium]|nr:diaminopimelate decarboxylase [candidate division Zixibacteria bacterium]
MDYFTYRKGELCCEDIPIRKIAEKYSTPLFIYSLKTLVRHFRVTSEAFGEIPHIICYAAKANPNLAILKVASLCGAGCDVVSEGELCAALTAGIKPERIVFSGVGKTEREIEYAVSSKILFLCAESLAELEMIAAVGKRRKTKVPVAIRVNPDIDPGTHPYIATGLKKTKFGLDEKTARRAYRFCKEHKWLEPVGISMHIGSQVESVKPYITAAKKIVEVYKYLWKQSIHLRYIDIGGGWAAHLRINNRLPGPNDYVSAVKDLFSGLPVTVIAEPGRSLVGNAGILIMRVISTKKTEVKDFCIVDAAMNDFVRPSLYGAKHRIDPVVRKSGAKVEYDIVGPVCESGDFLGRAVKLPKIYKGDLLCLFTAGAYGSAMSSNYNSRRRAAEVAVAGKKVILIKERETFDDLLAGQNKSGIDD